MRTLGLVVLLALATCDSHTALRAFPCAKEGDVQACTDPCGEGEKVCRQGNWSGCEVAPVRKPCTDVCGEGTKLCEKGILSTVCEVAPVRLPCANTCGEGTKLCADHKMGVCEVAPTRLGCTNTCGVGTQRCENNKLVGVCEVEPVVRACSSICGAGTETCENNAWKACTAPLPKSPALRATLRDFHEVHPDFGLSGVDDRGFVAPGLGADDKPVYWSSYATSTTSGAVNFNQWFRDVPGVNQSTAMEIPLTPASGKKGVYVYENQNFFPIDGQLFGNEGNSHNYSFTLEIATRFRYSGGEVFTFEGDDDVFVFINRTLVIDLGGIHEAEQQTVDLDAKAATLGLQKGEIYPMHIFFAERHQTGSNFILSTTISEFDACR